MAEIKSTLDIIMERTRGLTMTENEKKAFKERETAGKIKGLVQRYVDSAIDLSRFQKELTILNSEVRDELMVARLLGEECLDRIELGKDPERLFEILEKATTVDVSALKEKLKGVEKTIKVAVMGCVVNGGHYSCKVPRPVYGKRGRRAGSPCGTYR